MLIQLQISTGNIILFLLDLACIYLHRFLVDSMRWQNSDSGPLNSQMDLAKNLGFCCPFMHFITDDHFSGQQTITGKTFKMVKYQW